MPLNISVSFAVTTAAAAAADAVRFLMRKGTGHPVGWVSSWLAAGFAEKPEDDEDDPLGPGGDTPEEKEEARRKEREQLAKECQPDK